jgi:hypothetical protein
VRLIVERKGSSSICAEGVGQGGEFAHGTRAITLALINGEAEWKRAGLQCALAERIRRARLIRMEKSRMRMASPPLIHAPPPRVTEVARSSSRELILR